jgi:hypothetical protein
VGQSKQGDVGMTFSSHGWVFARTLIALAAQAAIGVAQANTPLSLSASQSLTYDSNVMRDNNNKYRDAISTTSVTLGFDKEYGRQSYNASLTGQTSKYKNTKDFDNNGYDIQLGFSSSLASNWQVALNHYRVKQLQRLEEQSGSRYPENIVSSVTQAVVQYGVFGRWSTNMALGHSKSTYETRTYYDRESDYVKLGVRYSPTDLLYFDVGVRKTDGDSPKYPLLDGSVLGDPLKRTDYELSSQWIVTGYSRFTARVGWTQERHSRDSLRDYNGLTGNVRWIYSPTGKTTYSVALDRDTNNAGGGTYLDMIPINGGADGEILGSSTTAAQNRVATSIYLTANHNTTAKISLNAGLTYRQFKEEYRQVYDNILLPIFSSTFSNRDTGNYRSFSLGVRYQIHRRVGLGCNVERYDRSASVFTREYDGEQVSCNLNVKVD